jgi:alkaline phosphatase D
VVLSQTIFCKVTTHSGPQLRPSTIDLDCGGWPQSARRRALKAILPANALMIHGDQHLGALVHHGIDRWEDGPIAFMVPGTANGFPRAWWPEVEKADGRYLDGLGNRMTVLAVVNPDRGSNELPRATTNPEELAHRKGSGYGIVRFDKTAGTITFETWRYLFDAAKAQPRDQFPGFPRTIKWKSRNQ